MTTPNSTTSEPYKHLRIAKSIMVRQIAAWQKRRFWVWSISDVLSRIRVGQRYHLDRHGQLALKQLRLSVLNEMRTNSYTGPRLLTIRLRAVVIDDEPSPKNQAASNLIVLVESENEQETLYYMIKRFISYY